MKILLHYLLAISAVAFLILFLAILAVYLLIFVGYGGVMVLAIVLFSIGVLWALSDK